jgi:hypothetical protein
MLLTGTRRSSQIPSKKRGLQAYGDPTLAQLSRAQESTQQSVLPDTRTLVASVFGVQGMLSIGQQVEMRISTVIMCPHGGVKVHS